VLLLVVSTAEFMFEVKTPTLTVATCFDYSGLSRAVQLLQKSKRVTITLVFVIRSRSLLNVLGYFELE
jgi:hypothetical protein